MDGPIAIVTALPQELRGILHHASDIQLRHHGFIDARIGAANVVLIATGEGAGNARRVAGEICEAVRPVALVGAGVAGSLSRQLVVGDLVVALKIRDSRGEVPAPDERLLARALSSGASAGTLLTVERPAVSPSEKIALTESLDADTFAAVDMESAAWARAAGERGVPYLVVRSISDRVEEELPEYLARCVRQDGSLRRLAVVGHSLLRPRTIPVLLRMRKRTYRCGRRLGKFLKRFLAE